MRNTVPLWGLCTLNDETLSEKTDPALAFDYVDISNVTEGSISDDLESLTFATAPSRARRIAREGDVIVSTVRTYLRAIAQVGKAGHQRVYSTGFAVLRPDTIVTDPRYVSYVLGSDQVMDEIVATSVGVSYPAIQGSALHRIRVPHHDLATQQRIADYLDRETGEIDAMIAKMDELAGQLEARRDVAWGAEFEAASEVSPSVRLSLLIESIADGPFGSSLTSSHYSEDGARVVRLGNLGINTFRDDDKAFIPLAYAEKLDSHAVVQGDVVVAGLGDERMPLGRATVLPDIGPAIVKADCYRVRPNELVTSNYLAWALSAPQSRDQFKLLSRGTTRARLNTKVVQEIQLPLISVDQQVQLVERQSALTARIDAMLTKVAELKSLLTERRAALITDVVTGRKEVA